MANSLDLLHANDRQGTYPPSWYASTTRLPEPLPRLEGRHLCDVCVIGAGYTGLSAALHLRERGYSVIVLEAHRAGWGASGRNGGQVGSGQRRDQDWLEAQYGEAVAARLWELGEEAKALVRFLAGRHAADSHPTHGILHADHRLRYLDHSRAYVEKLNTRYGYDAIRFVDTDEMQELVGSMAYHGGSLDTGAFHVQPLAYAIGLAGAARDKGASIFENSTVRKIEQGSKIRVATDHGSVEAGHVVLACNGYLGGLDMHVARRVMPINNFVIATEPLQPSLREKVMTTQAAVADSKFVVNYFRLTPDGRMLFGGGENYGYRFPADIKRFVQKPMLEIFPQLKDTKIDHGWGGTLAITMKRLPFFWSSGGKIFNASGYSGHGVAMATLAGKLVAEAVQGQAERFDLMASLGIPAFPGGTALRHPLLVLAMTWFSLRDRL